MPRSVHGKRVKTRTKCQIGAPANVDALLQRNSDLASFLADGAILWATDDRYDEPCNARLSYSNLRMVKRKSFVLLDMRLTCKDIRKALDDRLKEWMEGFKEQTVETRKWYLKSHCCAPDGYAMTDGRTDVRDSDSESTRTQLRKCAEAQNHYSRAWLNLCAHCGDLVSHNILSFLTESNTFTVPQNGSAIVHMLPSNACTVLAMATQTCQVHGFGFGRRRVLEGLKGCCRNLVTSHIPTRVGTSFTVIEGTDGVRHMVFALKGHVDEVSVRPSTWRLLNNNSKGESCPPLVLNYLLVQAMFHMCGVWPPYAAVDVNRATGWWGKNPLTSSTTGARHLPQTFWPAQLFIARQAGLPAETTSLQGLLGLDDNQMRQCEAEALRKMEQKAERMRRARAREIEEIMEDISVAIEVDDKLPFSCFQELEDSSPAIGCTLRTLARVDRTNDCGSGITHHHGLSVPSLRCALSTCRIFYSDVLQEDRLMSPGMSSSDAYAYVAGLHYGMYGEPGGEAGTWTNNVYGGCDQQFQCFVQNVKSGHYGTRCPIVHICQSLRFFDGLSETLTPIFIHPDGDCRPPHRWLLVVEDGSSFLPQDHVLFKPRWLIYFQLQAFVDSVECLLERTGCKDLVKIPKLFSKEEMLRFEASDPRPNETLPDWCYKKRAKRGPVKPGSKEEAACSVVVAWYVETFRALAYQPCTRCAALDLIGMRGFDIVREQCAPGHSDGQV